MGSDGVDVEEKKLVGCPLRISFVCVDAGGEGSNVSCAWWIPGAECCAIVLIARKLASISAMLQTKYDYL